MEDKKLDLRELMKLDIKDIFNQKNFSKWRKKKIKKVEALPKLVVSLDFGSESIKVVEGRYQKNHLKIMKCITIPHQQCIENGMITNETKLIALLTEQLKAHGIKAKDAICIINSTQIINRELFVMPVDEEEMDTVIRYEIQQFLPINMSDYLIQYVVLDEVVINEEKKLKLNVITFPEKIALSYYELLKKCQLKPYALDLSYNAIGKLANYSNLLKGVSNEEGTLAFVDIGSQFIDLSIFNKRNIQFTRLIKSGSTAIENRVSELSNLSIKSTVPFDQVDLYGEDVESRAVVAAVDEMIYELVRVIRFYQNKVVGNSVDHIYIFGGSTVIPGLADYIGLKIGIPTTRLEKLTGVSLEVPDENIPFYANAIGAIIRL